MPALLSIAFKCTYNNGGEGPLVGFAGTCDEENIARNIRNGRVWCSHPTCPCRSYYDRGFRGVRPERPCMESHIFEDWRFGAGTIHHGARAGMPLQIRHVDVGKIACLTTRFPGESEDCRRVVGLFRIGAVELLHGETILIAATDGRVRLQLDEARRIYYWAYARTSSRVPSWHTGLFRYLGAGQVHRILVDVRDTTRHAATCAQVESLLAGAFGPAAAPPATGLLADKSPQARPGHR